MSYYDLIEEDEEFTPRDLAEKYNMADDMEEDNKVLPMISDIIYALYEIQDQTMDDTAKWYAMKSLVQSLYRVDPDIPIRVTKDGDNLNISVGPEEADV